LSHGIWSVGSGLGCLFLISGLRGNRCYLTFIAGWLAPFLVVSFFISTWSEGRIFYPIYPLLIASFASFIRLRLTSRATLDTELATSAADHGCAAETPFVALP
ncbi:MAG TPA: hypothetical protein VHV08_11670, partial [Pirellulales bacterium]|nr:hypothetical protein [Pirellulales bacterium]